jgi:AraC-like DNA-binding protein
MSAPSTFTQIKSWKSEQFCNTRLSSYTLHHHSFPRHFHEHYVIELVVDGADKFYCNRGTYTASAGELVFINPGEVHTGSTVEGSVLSYYSIAPEENELNRIASLLEKNLSHEFYFSHAHIKHPLLANKILLLFRALESSPFENLQFDELFLDLMNTLLSDVNNKDESPKTNSKDKRVEQLIDLMYASMTEPISLQQMAKYVNISPYHLIRLFKAQTGLSPYEYLVILRIEFAKQLLKKGHHVKDAAWDAGFYDTSHFNRLFRKFSGVTPKFFRSSK